MKSTEIRKSCSELRTIWVIGNEYLQKAAPWSSFKENPKKSEMIIRFALNLIYFYSLISEPFIPSSCEKIQKHFQFTKVKIFPDNLKSFIDALSDVNEISVPKILFQKISDEETMNYQKEFSGS